MTEGRTARGGYARGRARKEEILDAALVLFGERGYRATSLRDVASRVGMTHPGVLHHFPSKEHLLAAVLDRRDRMDEERLAHYPDDGLGRLVGLVDVVRRNAATPAIVELFCVLSAEATAPGHPAHGFFRERYRRGREELERVLRQLADAGQLRAGVEPAWAARATFAVMDGLQVQWLLDRSSTDMAADLQAHLSSLLTVPLPRSTSGPGQPTSGAGHPTTDRGSGSPHQQTGSLPLA